MFLIRLEFICLGIQTERLMQQPGTVYGIFFLAFIIRFISTAGQFLSICIFHAESILFRLGRSDIKKGGFMSENTLLFSIFHFDKICLFSNKSGFLRSKKHFRHLPQKPDHLVMCINPDLFIKLSSCHSLTVHSQHPDNSQEMIYMLMGNKNCMNVLPADTCILQLFQDRASAASVNQKIFLLVFFI